MGGRGQDYERELKTLLESRGFLVLRSAGSFNVDIMALKGGITLLIEVKSSSRERIYFTPRLKEQLELFIEKCALAQMAPIYCFRMKGSEKGWRVFTVPLELRGVQSLIQEKLPKLNIKLTGDQMSARMDWKDGAPLSTFLDYIDHLSR
jgi:Holliday junction resolvase